MKCPNCGSERIQYATKSSGGGFSFLDSCCGFVLLGPLGLLCGACGSGTQTEEFWICQDCGTKFSNRSAQQRQSQENAARMQKEQDDAKFLRYKEELYAIQATEGDFQTIRKRSQEINQQKEEAKKREEWFIDCAKNSPDPTMAKLANAGKWAGRLALISFLLGVLLLFIGGASISVVLLPAAIGLTVVWYARTNEARKHMMEYSQEFNAIATESDAMTQEAERLNSLVEKINFVERYQP